MIREQYFEEYELESGRASFGRTITEADITIHAGQTGDFFPHHMEAESGSVSRTAPSFSAWRWA